MNLIHRPIFIIPFALAASLVSGCTIRWTEGGISGEYRGQYMAYALAGTAGETLDQTTLDETTAQAFLDQWSPILWADAGEFVNSLDSSLIPLALVKGTPECINSARSP